MKEPQMMEITTLVEANSAGARIAAVAIEYSDAVLGEKLRAEDFEIEGYPMRRGAWLPERDALFS